MECITTNLPGAKLIIPKVHADDRGFFFETWKQNTFDELLNNGMPLNFTQDNHSSSMQHALRGLHFQYKKPQGKLVRVVHGEVYDVIVDLRQTSATYGMWQGFYLTAENKQMLWVPPGFAHGFYTVSARADICYKCTDYYNPGDEYTIIWNDPALAIDWPLITNISPVLSQKDALGIAFAEAPKFS